MSEAGHDYRARAGAEFPPHLRAWLVLTSGQRQAATLAGVLAVGLVVIEAARLAVRRTDPPVWKLAAGTGLAFGGIALLILGAMKEPTELLAELTP